MEDLTPVRSPRRPALALIRPLAVVMAALAVASVLIAVLEANGVADASSAYLLAVVLVAVVVGTRPAIATAIGAFLLYDALFIAPRLTLTVSDPAEWLNLLLLLVVGIVVGRLAGRERDRAESAIADRREAQALFDISYALANATAMGTTLGGIAELLRADTRATRAWITVGENVVADSASGGTPPISPSMHALLRRRPGDEPAEWVRLHTPGRSGKAVAPPAERAYKVVIGAGSQSLGSIWTTRPRDLGEPDPGETRILASAADQIGGALERDRLQREATTAEISRRSDALKSALLDSVSHDLRTPLASIRAAAGTLMDPDVDWPADERRAIAASIDREADWLNRLVTNLLDMSRVDAGELRPSLSLLPLADVVAAVMARFAAISGERSITVDVADDLPPVRADEVLLDQVLTNVIDNALKYAGSDAPIRVGASATGPDRIRLTVEDGGPGVPQESLSRLFEKFYRVPRRGEGSRRGTGIGLAVVRGLMEAMGGEVHARPSALGGLAVDLEIPTPPGDAPSEGVA